MRMRSAAAQCPPASGPSEKRAGRPPEGASGRKRRSNSPARVGRHEPTHAASLSPLGPASAPLPSRLGWERPGRESSGVAHRGGAGLGAGRPTGTAPPDGKRWKRPRRVSEAVAVGAPSGRAGGSVASGKAAMVSGARGGSAGERENERAGARGRGGDSRGAGGKSGEGEGGGDAGMEGPGSVDGDVERDGDAASGRPTSAEDGRYGSRELQETVLAKVTDERRRRQAARADRATGAIISLADCVSSLADCVSSPVLRLAPRVRPYRLTK